MLQVSTGVFRPRVLQVSTGVYTDTGDGTCLSISMWETHAEAEAAAPVAANWVREHLADRVELRSNDVGDLAFFEGVPATV